MAVLTFVFGLATALTAIAIGMLLLSLSSHDPAVYEPKDTTRGLFLEQRQESPGDQDDYR